MDDKIRGIEIDGVHYYELYAACPICFEQGKNSAAMYWEHKGCVGKVYVGDDAYFYCSKCKQRCHVGRAKYGCPGHSNSDNNEIFFDISSDNLIIYNISSFSFITTSLMTLVGLPWIRRFSENIVKNDSSEI